jgi:hypothetical protein
MKQKRVFKDERQTNYFFITYGDKNYSIQRKRIVFQAKKFKIFKKIFSYKYSSLNKDFKKRFSNLLKSSKGAGYWIWKSQIILQSLEKMNKNDILIYVDSGSTLNIRGKERLIDYFEMLNKSSESIFLFSIPGAEDGPGLIEKHWTTKEVFEYFDVQNNKEITDSTQFMGGVLLVKNNETSKKFFREFQNIVDGNNNFITDYYSSNQNLYFEACRHDQSILSVMGKLYGCLSMQDEFSYFYKPKDQYNSPILTVRDGVYNKWQKIKFYSFYPLNIRKVIFFKEKPYYFKNKKTIYSKVFNKIFISKNII